MKQNKISIIIPVFNEAIGIGALLKYLKYNAVTESVLETIIVDGGSVDNTVEIAKSNNVVVLNSEKGRAKQMNFGAKRANGDVFYFLHADTLPPKGFDRLILDACNKGIEAGCFRMKFDSNNIILRFFGWLSRINHTSCRGGDQSLFVSKMLFNKCKGFNERYIIYEDGEFINRLYKETDFKVLPKNVITSARKYREKGWLKVQFHFGMIHLKNHLGASPEELYDYYTEKLVD